MKFRSSSGLEFWPRSMRYLAHAWLRGVKHFRHEPVDNLYRSLFVSILPSLGCYYWKLMWCQTEPAPYFKSNIGTNGALYTQKWRCVLRGGSTEFISKNRTNVVSYTCFQFTCNWLFLWVHLWISYLLKSVRPYVVKFTKRKTLT